MTDKTRNQITAAGIVALGVILAAILALSGFARTSDLKDEVLQRTREDAAIRAELRANDSITQRKLDCALFDLPKGCRETMSPRGMP